MAETAFSSKEPALLGHPVSSMQGAHPMPACLKVLEVGQLQEPAK